jgi:hypothetical protein
LGRERRAIQKGASVVGSVNPLCRFVKGCERRRPVPGRDERLAPGFEVALPAAGPCEAREAFGAVEAFDDLPEPPVLVAIPLASALGGRARFEERSPVREEGVQV